MKTLVGNKERSFSASHSCLGKTNKHFFSYAYAYAAYDLFYIITYVIY